ncbi:MAG TPA: hypothetical protein VFR18_24075 [Terriglobia bacterium]|nr:hypothetical protein [Terriglobia bacterium]
MVSVHGLKVIACAATALLLLRGKAVAQSITTTSNGTLTVSIPFANLTPGTSTTPSSTEIQFRIRTDSNTGYRVRASAIFNVAANSPVDGGSTVTASDIGVGISSLIAGSSVQKPRTDSIAAGFNYNPAAVSAVNGLTPYAGMTAGQATLADLVANPNLTIVSGPKISNNDGITHPNNFITVTVTFGLVGQFFTPSTLSGILTLSLVDGP